MKIRRQVVTKSLLMTGNVLMRQSSWFRSEFLYRRTQSRADFVFVSTLEFPFVHTCFLLLDDLCTLQIPVAGPRSTWEPVNGRTPGSGEDFSVGDVQLVSTLLHPQRYWFGIDSFHGWVIHVKCGWVLHMKLAPSWLGGVMDDLVGELQWKWHSCAGSAKQWGNG